MKQSIVAVFIAAFLASPVAASAADNQSYMVALSCKAGSSPRSCGGGVEQCIPNGWSCCTMTNGMGHQWCENGCASIGGGCQ